MMTVLEDTGTASGIFHVPCPDVYVMVRAVLVLAEADQGVIACAVHPTCLAMLISSWMYLAQHIDGILYSDEHEQWRGFRARADKIQQKEVDQP